MQRDNMQKNLLPCNQLYIVVVAVFGRQLHPDPAIQAESFAASSFDFLTNFMIEI